MGAAVLHHPGPDRICCLLGKALPAPVEVGAKRLQLLDGYDRVNKSIAELAAQEIGVNDGPDALRLVDFLLRPTPCAPDGPRGSGTKRPLMNC